MRTIMRAALVAALAGLGFAARADEEKVPLDKLPKAISRAVKKRFPKGEMKEAAKETENGKTVYEVTVKDDGHSIDASFTAEGKLIGLEKEIEAKDLPKAVADALAAKYPGAKHKRVEEVIKVTDGKESLEYYEVLVETADGKKVEAEVTADGTVKKTEDKKGEKKD